MRAEVLRWVGEEVFLRFVVETLAEEALVARGVLRPPGCLAALG